MITTNRLEAVSREILQKFGDETRQKLRRIAKEVAKDGVKELKRSASSLFQTMNSKTRPQYRNSWSVFEERNLDDEMTVTIYSVNYWQPHLLEYPHIVGRHGFYRGRSHIEKVEKMVQDEVVKRFEEDFND